MSLSIVGKVLHDQWRALAVWTVGVGRARRASTSRSIRRSAPSTRCSSSSTRCRPRCGRCSPPRAWTSERRPATSMSSCSRSWCRCSCWRSRSRLPLARRPGKRSAVPSSCSSPTRYHAGASRSRSSSPWMVETAIVVARRLDRLGADGPRRRASTWPSIGSRRRSRAPASRSRDRRCGNGDRSRHREPHAQHRDRPGRGGRRVLHQCARAIGRRPQGVASHLSPLPLHRLRPAGQRPRRRSRR